MGIEPEYISGMKREVNLLNDYSAYRKIKKIIREFKPDIVHTHAAKAGALGRIAAAECGVRAIVHTFHGHVFHSYFGKLTTGIFIRVERYLAAKSHAIIAVSEKQKEELSSQFRICPPEKISVIPLGFDLSRFAAESGRKREHFRKRFGISEEETVIGIIGRIVPVKNHSFFLHAMKKVFSRTNKKVRCMIIGDGEDRKKIQSLASELGLSWCDESTRSGHAQVIFTSWIKEIDYALAGIDITALTSLNEGTPVSLIEAQAAGKPVVSTRTGGIENVVIPGETALLSSVTDIDAFAGHCISLVADPALRREMGAAGRKSVQGRFTCEQLAENTRSLYRKILSGA
jgi:glycosyltransferase involved in cell wall biosynthesis